MSETALKIGLILDLPQLRADWKGDPDVVVGSISTDSRSLRPGEWFCAIRGERFDGHRFVDRAFEQGAAGAIVERAWAARQPNNTGEKPLLIVDDTLVAYQEIARCYRELFTIPVIAITGSSGKTTCKEMIAAVLSQRFSVHRNCKSYNNHIGVPATLLGLSRQHEILVAEVGTNHFGELRRLGYLLQPNLAVVTNIGYAHLEAFGSLDGVLRAKLELFEALAIDGTAFYNCDDPHLATAEFHATGRSSFGLKACADVRGSNLECDELACYRFQVDGISFRLTTPGRYNVYNALAAIAVGRFFGLSDAEIQAGLLDFTAAEKRMEIERVGGALFLNATYNANPSSMATALETLQDFALPANGRRIAVLSDMLELGDYAVPEHRNLADRAVAAGVDLLFLFGELVRHTAKRAHEFPGLQVRHFDDKQELAQHLLRVLQPTDVVLVKGSRAMQMEAVIEFIQTRKSE
ncbi:UDP-N-acetylmuramoyl-tripeptide--D-alanyl-D-alanine ligase [candidate division KSB1 bacterium]|nr:UDP-N-acetylmuramoyl-tripeptide--D-alanyl-D-alanine ligase [candidate division KSB1 bacterium]